MTEESILKPSSHVKLLYFDKRANAECIRFLLSYGKIEFEDIRIERDTWLEMKKTTTFERLPILYINEEEFDTTIAICRYLGNQIGISGLTDKENYHIDRVVGQINELRVVVSEYNLELQCSPRRKILISRLENDLLPFYLERFNQLAANGYIANGKLSWADFYLVTFLDYATDIIDEALIDPYNNLKQLCITIYGIPEIKQWVAKRPYSQY